MYHPDLGYVGDGPPETETQVKVFARRASCPGADFAVAIINEAMALDAALPETGRASRGGDSKGSSQALTPEDTRASEEAQGAQKPETHHHPAAIAPCM